MFNIDIHYKIQFKIHQTLVIKYLSTRSRNIWFLHRLPFIAMLAQWTFSTSACRAFSENDQRICSSWVGIVKSQTSAIYNLLSPRV